VAINIPIISEFDGKGVSKAIKEFKQLETAGEKAQFAIKKAAIPAAAALGGLAVAGYSAAKAAMEDQKSSAELARQLKISTQATDDQVAATEDLIGKMTLATGVADTELRTAYANLARSTGSAEESQRLLNLSLDIAAATGKDLTTVSTALGKAYNGQESALAKLDPSMKGLIEAGASADEIFNTMAQTFGGAAADAANTAEGRFKRMGVAIGEAQESIGMALLPIIEELLPYLERLATWVGENTDLVVVLGASIGGLAAAVISINAAMKVFTAVQTAATAAQTLFNAAAAANPYILIAAAVVAATTAIFVFRKQIAQSVKDFDDFFERFGILGELAGAAGKLSIPGLGAIGSIGSLLNKIPGLADGGIVRGPTLAMIGEAGPEAVVPLDRMGGMGGGVTINVHGGDPNSVVDALRTYMRQNGSVPIRVGNAY